PELIQLPVCTVEHASSDQYSFLPSACADFCRSGAKKQRLTGNPVIFCICPDLAVQAARNFHTYGRSGLVADKHRIVKLKYVLPGSCCADTLFPIFFTCLFCPLPLGTAYDLLPEPGILLYLALSVFPKRQVCLLQSFHKQA